MVEEFMIPVLMDGDSHKPVIIPKSLVLINNDSMSLIVIDEDSFEFSIYG